MEDKTISQFYIVWGLYNRRTWITIPRSIVIDYNLTLALNKLTNDKLIVCCDEGESISNQPIPFPIDRDAHDFHALFQCMIYTWVQNYTRIESFFNKMQPSAGKVMATVFWDAKGVIMLDFLPKRSTITGVYYANLFDQLRTAIREKR